MDQLPHMLRADARVNRDRVLDAARALFAERGLDVTMRDVARRAGVGPATLYRRFPAKSLLVREVFDGELRACRQIVIDGCTDPDPWRGFCSVIERISVLNARNQGFVDAFMSTQADTGLFVTHRAELVRLLSGLASRAQAAGGLRRDFVVDDLLLVLTAGRGLTALPTSQRVPAARRFAALNIEAFRATDAVAALPPAPRLVRAVASVPEGA